MTQDKIIEMARQVCDVTADSRGRESFEFDSHGLEAFAKLVMKHDLLRLTTLAEMLSNVQAVEREACAKIADQISDKYSIGYYGSEVDAIDEVADAIRARGEA